MSKTKIVMALLIAVSTAAPAASPTAYYANYNVLPSGGISCWEGIFHVGVGMPDVGPDSRGSHWQPCM
jgi:hypothetical protein